jgi:hypothetical protein
MQNKLNVRLLKKARIHAKKNQAYNVADKLEVLIAILENRKKSKNLAKILAYLNI